MPDGSVGTVHTPTLTSLHLPGAAGGSGSPSRLEPAGPLLQDQCVDRGEGDWALRAGLEDGYECARSTGAGRRRGLQVEGEHQPGLEQPEWVGSWGHGIFTASHPG